MYFGKAGSAIAAVLVLSAALAACNGDDGGGDTTAAGGERDTSDTIISDEIQVVGESALDRIQERGTLIAGSTLQFPPERYRDDNDEPAGFDIELMELLAADLGVELEIVDQDFETLIPGLLANEFDMITVGLVGRPARLRSAWFTDAYVPYTQHVVVAPHVQAQTVDEFRAEAVTVTALTGSTAASLAGQQFPDAEIVELDQQPAFLEVASDRADGIVVETYLACQFIAENEGTRILELDNPFATENGAYAIPYGDVEWLQYLNAWIAYYEDRGTLDAIYDQIIGPTFEGCGGA